MANKINKDKIISEEEILRFLEKRKPFLEGVCITGGEPTMHSDLPDFIKKLKNMGYLVKLDTNGTNPQMLSRLIKEKLLDYVAMDIKSALGKYSLVTKTKVDISQIKKSIRILKRGLVSYEFRTTLMPALFAKEDFEQIGKALAGAKKYYLQNFRKEKSLVNKNFDSKKFSRKEIEDIKNSIKKYFDLCEIRNA